jgi:hypothetical protein
MSRYSYTDIGELRQRLLAEIQRYFECRTCEFQEQQYDSMLDNVLAQVEQETR